MICPECNRNKEKSQMFCTSCSTFLQMTCQGCGALVRLHDKFCAECGIKVGKGEGIDRKARGVSERKYITAMFADVSGYTSLVERLDPEEVREIMNALFNEITKIILKYEGFIEKFAGDAVLAIFGIPWSHKDDPIRAIRAAQEVHRAVKTVSLQFQNRIEEPLSVHIGINTGLVVTGEITPDEGTHQIAGDSINVASRLCSLAKSGETLIGQITYSQAEGIFSFERLEPVKVKGRTKPVLVYKILGSKELPSKTHRISGRRADLIGRQAEMISLQNAVEKLLKGRRSVIAVYGKAGTGKSRLLEDFKANLDQPPSSGTKATPMNARKIFPTTPSSISLIEPARSMRAMLMRLPGKKRKKRSRKSQVMEPMCSPIWVGCCQSLIRNWRMSSPTPGRHTCIRLF
jgi:class 3 adenylate cyclase